MLRIIFVTFFTSLFSLIMSGQSQVDINLEATPTSGGLACFDISVKSGGNADIDLAGQNYRLFYDADKLEFLEEKSSYSFDPRAYGRVYVHNTETKGVGFLSLSLDGQKLTDKMIVLKQGGLWHQVMNVCFKETTETPYDLTWAHRTRTARFASAEVALSEWVDGSSQQALTINELQDFTNTIDAIDGTAFQLNVYPNPVLDYINVEVLGNNTSRQLIIKDIVGREVVYDNISGDQVTTYDMVNWPEGSYTVELLNEDAERIAIKNVIKVGIK